jgi:rhamnogalacturonyl hydrolase YesR
LPISAAEVDCESNFDALYSGSQAGLNEMNESVYVSMCFAHRVAKTVLRRQREPTGVRFVDIRGRDVSANGTVLFEGLDFAEIEEALGSEVKIDQLYPVENAVPLGSNPHLRTSYERRPLESDCQGTEAQRFSPGLWRKFIDRADIPAGYRNAGLKYAGYIASGRDSWCLPSWIWTNAAIVRYFCEVGDLERAVTIGDVLVSKQEGEGGWVVRSDYTTTDEIPVIAPNDSAYIANNACLRLYRKTGQEKFLLAAERCANWIMETARPDGLVWTGYNKKTGAWLKTHTIVDTGFTAGLFANLYILTDDIRYRSFLERFVERFIELFYDQRIGGFATSINQFDGKVGGRFARGQAWALEGLIPAYRALRSERLKNIVQRNVESLLREQLPNGAWAYNLDRAYYGEDCKGVPVIAKALLDWHAINYDDRLRAAAEKALDWCKAHTSLCGQSQGGIFSFNLEGAVVHNFYTKTAFVYSSAYALECLEILKSNE